MQYIHRRYEKYVYKQNTNQFEKNNLPVQLQLANLLIGIRFCKCSFAWFAYIRILRNTRVLY